MKASAISTARKCSRGRRRLGKKATAGVISFTTARPADEVFAAARVAYEFPAEEVPGDAVVSGTLSGRIGVRVAIPEDGVAMDFA